MKILLLLLSIATTLACKCSNYIPQTAACHADFVVKARVEHESGIRAQHGNHGHPYHLYTLTTLQVFKRTDDAVDVLGHGNFQFNITEPEGTSCSINLNKGQVYLITGRIHEGSVDINKCDWHLKWNDLTSQQKLGFRENYYKHC